MVTSQGEVLLQFMYGPDDGYEFTYQYQLHQLGYPIGYTVQWVLEQQ